MEMSIRIAWAKAWGQGNTPGPDIRAAQFERSVRDGSGAWRKKTYQRAPHGWLERDGTALGEMDAALADMLLLDMTGRAAAQGD